MRLFWIGLILIFGCGTTVLEQAEAESYGRQQVLCVARGGDRGQVDYCRDAIKEYYCSTDGGALVDAGACLNVVLSNGNRP